MRKFDKSYLLLIFPVLRMTWPILQYRFKPITIAPFVIMWFIMQHLQNRRCYARGLQQLQFWFYLMIAGYLMYYLLPLMYGLHNLNDRMSFQLTRTVAAVVSTLFMLYVVHYSLLYGKIKELKFIVILVIFSMLWMGGAALLGGERVAEFGSARLIAAAGVGGAQDIQSQYYLQDVAAFGMGGNASVYISAFVAPLVIYAIFHVRGKIKKIICASIFVSSFLNIKYGGLNTPYMILAIGMAIMGLAVISRSKALVLSAGFLLAILMVVFSFFPTMFSFLAPPLNSIALASENFPQLKVRCESMVAALEGDKDSYAARRYELQQRSAKSFAKGNILFGNIGKGNSDSLTGGHSELLDCLAVYGLIGAFVLFLFWFGYLKYNEQLARMYFGRKWLMMPYIYTASWIFSSIPNPALLGAPTMMLIIPGMALFFAEVEDGGHVRFFTRPCW